jgi:hypothetical protein
MTGANIVCELPLKIGDLAPEDKGRVVDYTLNRPVDLGFYGGVLRLQIDQRY